MVSILLDNLDAVVHSCIISPACCKQSLSFFYTLLKLIETIRKGNKRRHTVHQIKIVLMVKVKVTKNISACLVCIYVADLPQYACWI